MIAFHGKQEIKDFYMARLQAHAATDEVIHGKYWVGGKGCAVGCTIHSGKHKHYESELAIPEQIAYLEDAIFEALPNSDAKTFPVRFLEAIPVGADLSMVIPKFLHWLLVDETYGAIIGVTDEGVKNSVVGVASLYRRLINGNTPFDREWEAAGKAAWAAWDAGAARAARAAGEAAWPPGEAARAAGEAFSKASAEKLLQLLADSPVPEGSSARANAI